jgi:plastocyanin
VSLLAVLGAATAFGQEAPPETTAPRAQRPGVLRGRVIVLRDVSAPAVRPSVSELGAPPVADVPDRRRSVVYLETAPLGAFEEPQWPNAVLDQRNQSFQPYVLAIPVGSTVEFPNNDRVYHNVFSLSKAKRFDLGRYPRGQSRSVRFDRPGVVRVFCEIHSEMSAFILVFAHRYFSATDAEGRYRIGGIPPGHYTLVVWNDGAERERQRVRIPDQGGDVELDLTVQ